MWLEELERRLIAFVWTLRLIGEQMRDFLGKLASIWSWDAWREWPSEELAYSSACGVVMGADLFDAGVLESSRRTYVLQAKIAAGDLCDVSLAVSEGERYVVKVSRVVGGAADALLDKEIEILRRLTDTGDEHHRRYFPQPVESFACKRGGPRCNVLAWEDGFYTAGEIVTRYPDGLDGRHLAWMFKRMLAALGYVHRQGWIHGAVLPPHLLFHVANHGLHLAGWIHAVRPGHPLTAVPAAFREWYPPEARYGAQPATDIYLAAKSIVYLAGGDPLGDVFPDHVPQPMQMFLRACLLESARMRPGDAWDLHDEFDQLLGELYGPPKYVRLTMT